MSIAVAKFGLSKETKQLTWQGEWDDRVECGHCHSKNTALILAAAEEWDKNGNPQVQDFLCKRYDNELAEGGLFWFHDCVAVALYICRNCAKATALWNQA